MQLRSEGVRNRCRLSHRCAVALTPGLSSILAATLALQRHQRSSSCLSVLQWHRRSYHGFSRPLPPRFELLHARVPELPLPSLALLQVQAVIKNRGHDKGTWYAMKTLTKSVILERNHVSMVMKERNLLSRLHCPQLVNMHYAFQDAKNLYIIMDVCLGGDLHYQLTHSPSRCFAEEQAKFYVASIILCLDYMHSESHIEVAVLRIARGCGAAVTAASMLTQLRLLMSMRLRCLPLNALAALPAISSTRCPSHRCPSCPFFLRLQAWA